MEQEEKHGRYQAMFPAQRIAKLKQILLTDKTVTIATLCEELEVSDVTVRKYLDELEKEGFLKKFHGGAILVEPESAGASPFSHLNTDPSLNLVTVDQIVSLATTMLEDNDTIFLGHGALCTAFASKLSSFSGISVLTNNINAVPALQSAVSNLYFIGGEIVAQQNNFFSCGQKMLQQLDGIFIQKAFYTVDGIDLQAGLTVNNFEACESLCKINRIARDVIIMAGSEKFNKICMHQVRKIDSDSIFVTDLGLDSKYKQYFFEHNIKVLTSYDL